MRVIEALYARLLDTYVRARAARSRDDSMPGTACACSARKAVSAAAAACR